MIARFATRSLSLLLVAAALAQSPSTQPVTVPAPEAAASAPANDPRALDLLKKACDRLTGAKSFETTCRLTRLMGTKDSGELLELRAKLLYAAKNRLRIVSDPARFSIAGKPSPEDRGLYITSIFDDGKQLHFVMPEIKRFNKKDAPPTAAEIFVGGKMPEGANFPGMTAYPVFLRDDPYKLMTMETRRSLYAGKEKVDGVECHVIRQMPADTEQLIDLRIWIEVDQPVFRQFRTDFSRAEAKGMQLMEPEITIRFEDWRFDGPVSDADFAYTPPADYKHVDTFMVDPSELAASQPASQPTSQPAGK